MELSISNRSEASMTPVHRHSSHCNSSTTQTPITSAITIGSKPSLLLHLPMRFLVMDAPRQSNLHLYIKELRNQGVSDLVRVCEPTYNATDLTHAGIELHEMAYDDGTSPPKHVLDHWLALVYSRYYSKSSNEKPVVTSATMEANNSNNTTAIAPLDSHHKTIAVHCVAGLGRAPVLVAIALIEFANMDPVDAVSFIRRHRRGAINEKQLNYLSQYKKQWRGNGTQMTACSCVLM